MQMQSSDESQGFFYAHFASGVQLSKNQVSGRKGGKL
jgi:hypothetical protein